MTWLLTAYDDDTLAAVLDDARVRSLDGATDFLLITPRSKRWGVQSGAGDRYLSSLDTRIAALREEGVRIDHDWVPGEELGEELIAAGRARRVEGVVIAHHNPNDAIPDPESFDDAIRDQLGVALDVISLE